MGQNKWRYNKKIHIWNKVRLSLRGKKIFVNQTLFSKLQFIGQIYAVRKNIRFLPERKNNRTSQAPSSTLHFEGWTRYFRHRNSKYLKIKKIQMLLNPTSALWKDLTLCRMNLILNYNQDIFLFRQKQILRYNVHQNLQKENNKYLFIQLLNTWLHFIINNFPTPTSI